MLLCSKIGKGCFPGGLRLEVRAMVAHLHGWPCADRLGTAKISKELKKQKPSWRARNPKTLTLAKDTKRRFWGWWWQNKWQVEEITFCQPIFRLILPPPTPKPTLDLLLWPIVTFWGFGPFRTSFASEQKTVVKEVGLLLSFPVY